MSKKSSNQKQTLQYWKDEAEAYKDQYKNACQEIIALNELVREMQKEINELRTELQYR